MRLIELHESKEEEEEEEEEYPKFAWLRSARGPNDIPGVELAYIQPLELYYSKLIKNAEDERKVARVDQLKAVRDNYREKGQTYFKPDLGWWMNKEDFDSGKEGFNGAHKGAILARFPSLRVFKTQQEAEAAAKQANLI